MDGDQPNKFTPEQKLFCVLSKVRGLYSPQIQSEFILKWPGQQPPDRRSILRFEKTLNEEKNLFDQRKGKSGRKITVRTPENINSVENLLESEKDRRPDQQGSSCRRNTLDISKTIFNMIVKKDLGWKPYKIVRRQKITPANAGIDSK